MKKIVIYTTLLTLAACSRTDTASDLSGYTNQGADAARMFIQQNADATEMQTINQLLEVRTTHSIILKKEGREAADAFESGFEEYLRQHNDSLYSLIKNRQL